jgi:hypothetical protein
MRRRLIDPIARDEAYPIDLMSVAQYLETTADLRSVFDAKDKTTRYYYFWEMFRASGIRVYKYRQGDTSYSNCHRLAYDYLEMSKIMLDHSIEGDKFIMHGDPTEAMLLVQSVYGLVKDLTDNLGAQALVSGAEAQWETLQKLERAMQANAHRFEVRPRYGPLTRSSKNGSEAK